tara:strand:- start:2060 stop:3364 length:1305 start_codon:yes stop_codon:yes gene_type:complete
MKKKISGWGKNTFVNTNISFPKNLSQLKKSIKASCIARGLGRSYGDSSINSQNTIITTQLKKIINFDKKKGILEAESGVSIEQILELIVSEGWFLPVTPGSKKITLGGMIASDIHGKNHHKVGNFSNFIFGFKLLDKKKKLIECSKNKNSLIFNNTIGGMGLTGIIYSCKIKLKKIESSLIFEDKIKNYNLKETLKSINESKNWDYNVAWIDTSSNIKEIGRSILTRGYFQKKKDYEPSYSKEKSLVDNLPDIFPNFFMNAFFIKLLNTLYFTFSKSGVKTSSINEFFYPLDKINNWNVVYGNKGFISYQCSVPSTNSYNSIFQILKILKENKIYSFVSVLKSMGKNNKKLSFGQKGYTLVFDFPIYSNVLDVLNKIDLIVLKNKGRVYLTKDSRISKENFIKINKEFGNSDFKKLRKKCNFYFNSVQSERLKI